ncbi:MAG: nuclear transport factor 2 family protein [Dehalococcoidia bacterium]
MSNIDTVNQLLTAINFDRFYEIEALHAPDVIFQSFRGPTLRDSVSVADWHRLFLREYADCNYTDLEYIEDGEHVVVRATIEAKGYDWRPFTQRVLEVFRVVGDHITDRRLYGMLRDLELDKPSQQALDAALEVRGGSRSETEKLVRAALEVTDAEAAAELFDPKAVLIDSVYGVAIGPENILALTNAVPRPAFGVERVTSGIPGEHDALVEKAIDPSRPRSADWYRIVDGKIRVIERYWMLREIGVNPYVNYSRDRHQRQVILPI